MTAMETDSRVNYVASPSLNGTSVSELQRPSEMTKRYIWGMSTLLSPFVAATSTVPPLLKCKIRTPLISETSPGCYLREPHKPGHFGFREQR